MFLDMVLMVVVLTSGHVESQAQSAGNCAHMRQILTRSPVLYWGNGEVHGQVQTIHCRSLVTGRDLIEGDGRPGQRSKQ